MYLPWSKLSKAVQDAKTAEEAIVMSGLDTKVECRPLYIAGENRVDGIPVIGPSVNRRRAVVRTLDNMPLGVVGMGYQPIQNRECFSFFDGLVENGKASYHSAGELNGGSKIFIVAEMNDHFKIGGDNIREFLLLRSAHDGSSSVHVTLAPYRMICVNGLMVKMQGMGNEIRIRHSRTYLRNMAQAREVLGFAEQYYKELETVFQRLVDTPMSDSEMKEFTKALVPDPKRGDGSEARTTKAERTRERISHLFHNGMGHEGITNTAWAAYNAVTEYADHRRPTRVREGRNPDEARFETNLFAGGANMKQKAFQLLTV